jgi:hypothetical protein
MSLPVQSRLLSGGSFLETSHAMHPASLAPGSIVGSWRLLAWVSQGSYGVVFRAERTANPEAGPFALKFALQPGDPRFALEVELLSRIHHPNVPRLHDSGEWSGPGGALFPFLVMGWVEGLPLYSWGGAVDRLAPAAGHSLKSEEWPPEDLADAEQLGHRPCRREREVVRVATGRGACEHRGAGHGGAGGSSSGAAGWRRYLRWRHGADVLPFLRASAPGEGGRIDGRCHKGKYAINGGCWVRVDVSDLDECKGIRRGNTAAHARHRAGAAGSRGSSTNICPGLSRKLFSPL